MCLRVRGRNQGRQGREGTQTRKANEENNEISVTLLGTFVLPIHTWYWYLGTGHQQKIMAAT